MPTLGEFEILLGILCGVAFTLLGQRAWALIRAADEEHNPYMRRQP